MSNVCYVTFGSGKPYAYLCGGLKPQPGDLIVVEVGPEAHLKLVKCVSLNEYDEHAFREIYGVVQLQPKVRT